MFIIISIGPGKGGEGRGKSGSEGIISEGSSDWLSTSFPELFLPTLKRKSAGKEVGLAACLNVQKSIHKTALQ